ncbi:MAG: trypsin-like peptidase domain-containing protein [Clostridia bacterium]|nr:trypsin-like peptidase domain-containing protein [Clostridia bacterium]
MDNNDYYDPRFTNNSGDDNNAGTSGRTDPERYGEEPRTYDDPLSENHGFGQVPVSEKTAAPADPQTPDPVGDIPVYDGRKFAGPAREDVRPPVTDVPPEPPIPPRPPVNDPPRYSPTNTGYIDPTNGRAANGSYGAPSSYTGPDSSNGMRGTYSAPTGGQSNYGNPNYGYGSTGQTVQQTKPQKTKKAKKSGGKSFVAWLIVACVIVSFVAGLGGAAVIAKVSGNSGTVQRQTYTGPSSQSGATDKTKDNGGKTVELPEGTVAAAAAKASDSVVVITTEQLATNFFYGQYVTEGAGSGVVYDAENGYIITCAHVVSGATKITVTLNDDTQATATLVGADSESDIAVIKIDVDNLVGAEIGDSDELVVGQEAVAIGNPLGVLGGSVSSGIISALDREITIDGQNYTLLQIDAAVNPGNSGGGLFDISGRLIGIVNAKSSGSDVDGLGFAIPINSASEVANQLISQGYVGGRTYLGIQAFEYSASTSQSSIYSARSSGLANYIDNYGVYFTGYLEGQSGDLKFGDRIVAIDGTSVSTLSDIKSLLSEHSVGDVVKLTVSRLDENTGRSQITELQQTLIERPAEAATTETQQPAQQNNGGMNGYEQFFGDFFN